VLQYHFNWKMLSAMAGVTWWNFYFRLFPGAIRSPQIIEFLSHLLRHIPGKLLIVWDGLPGHRSRATWEFIREQRGRLWVEFLPGYAPELIRSSTCGRTGNSTSCLTSVRRTLAS
jgi:transposase